MIPITAIEFEPADIEQGPTFIKSSADGSLGLVCRFASGQAGIIWLTGAEAGKTAHLAEGTGIFIKSSRIEVDLSSSISDGQEIPSGSVLVSPGCTAVRYETTRGATRIYPIAGTGRIDEFNFAAFSRWSAFASDRIDEKPIYRMD